MSATCKLDWLRAACALSAYRDAEAAFAQWLLVADAESVFELLPELSPRQARRLGHSLEVAAAARLLDRSKFAAAIAGLGERAGVDKYLGVVRSVWEPDMAFETGRLRQRVQEARWRRSA